MLSKLVIRSLILITLISCMDIEKKQSIIVGDWYVYSKKIRNEESTLETFDYTELFFSDNNGLYSYSNIKGLRPPQKYQLKKDSLFYYYQWEDISKKSFIGNLVFKNRDTMYLTDKIDTLYIYRISSKKNLLSKFLSGNSKDFEKFEKSHKEFFNQFFSRMERCYENSVK